MTERSEKRGAVIPSLRSKRGTSFNLQGPNKAYFFHSKACRPDSFAGGGFFVFGRVAEELTDDTDETDLHRFNFYLRKSVPSVSSVC
jgi:hypothetical protein